MPKADTLEIGQAFYGSFSGYHDYGILAASPAGASGFGREDHETISLRSSLGGSAQTAPSFEPFFTFYEIGRQRLWAFSRTVWLNRGPRGNDYLAHVLALSAEVMEALRGDPFLLLDFDLFRDSKPLREEPLEPLQVPLKEMEPKAIRHCGETGLEKPSIEGPVAASFLRTLTRGAGTLSLSLDDGEASTSLCRSIVSLLPPDDRVTLSFCSRFSLPRRTSFRLAVYTAEDAPLAERYLNGLNTEIAQGSDDLWSDWVSACESQEVEPFYGVSLRNETASGLLKIVRKLPGENLAAGEKRFLGPIALDPRNSRLPSVQRLLLPLAWEDIRSKAYQVVSAGSGVSPLEEACRKASLYDPTGRFLREKILAAAGQHGSRTSDLVEVTAILAMAVLVPGRARPGSILSAGAEPALFRSREMASWTLTMSELNREACRKLLSSWFIAWFQLVGPTILRPVLEELQRLKGQGPKAPVAAVSAFSALWDVKPGDKDLRFTWRTDLLRDGRKQLGSSLLSDRDIGHLVLEERHLDDMQGDEADSLLQVTCRELPAETEAWIEKKPTDRLLLAAASACAGGLAGIPPEQSWPNEDPRRWTLVAGIATILVLRAKAPSFEAGGGRILAHLLFSAAVMAPPAAITRIGDVVESTVEANVEGGPDLLLRAAASLAVKGNRNLARAITSRPALKVRSEEVLNGSSDEMLTWGGSLLAAAWRMLETCAT